MTSWTCDPKRRVCSNPSPISTPLTMLMLITAAASAASRRRSQWTYDPSPIGAPWTTTSNTPPTVSPFERASSILSIIAASATGSGQRSGEASASSRGRVALAGSSATPPTSAVYDQTSMPSSRRNARATPPAATLAVVSRADERSSALRTSLKPYLSEPARSACPGRTRVIGWARLLPPSASVGELRGLLLAQRPDLHDAGSSSPSRGCRPRAGSASRACGRAGPRTGSAPGRARSTGGRRGRSHAGGGRGRPRGRPRSGQGRRARPRPRRRASGHGSRRS